MNLFQDILQRAAMTKIENQLLTNFLIFKFKIAAQGNFNGPWKNLSTFWQCL